MSIAYYGVDRANRGDGCEGSANRRFQRNLVSIMLARVEGTNSIFEVLQFDIAEWLDHAA